MALHDRHSRVVAEPAHQRRSLFAALTAAVGLFVGGIDTSEAAKHIERKERKGKKKKRKPKHKRPGGSGCHVNVSEQQVLNYIAQAAQKYGQSRSVMERVARCESSLNPCALNSSGPYYGLFQYLKSTWQSTPYGNRSIWDPEAQALATGWMWKQGRKNEWACK